MLIESSPTNLDPRIGTDAASERIDALLFDALVRKDANYNIAPELATSWDTPDPLTYIFHLRAGVRFADGRPLTARDVKWTMDTILNGSIKTVKSAAYRSWKSIETPDPLTVVVHLRQPDTGLLLNVCDAAFGAIPYGSGADLWRHPIGSGPFTFVSQEQDKEVVVRRNPLYWGGAPSIENVRFAVVPDAITRALELQKGSADIEVNALPTDLLPTLARNPHLAVQSAPGTTLVYVVFNLRDAHLRDLRVREAIAAAVDRSLVVRTLMDGRARTAGSVLPPEHWAFTADDEQHPFNPAAANALLDQAGYPRGRDGVRFHVVLKSSTDEQRRLICAVLQSQLAAVGIALDIRSYEFATFYSDMTKGAFSMALSNWIGANEAPDIFGYAYSSTRMPPHGANRGFYSNPQVDALIADGAANADHAVQVHDYEAVQSLLAHDLPVLNLFYMDTVAVQNTRLTPLALRSSGNFDFLRTAALRKP
ncbi:ABC transporter substrate-binding protein [Acidipila sp. EB88]|nr:ABC transporter substrate-binding protein [Acidipila sp. EB88]